MYRFLKILWAVNCMVEVGTASAFILTRYNQKVTRKVLNKWLKQYVPDGCTMHSFRHSMRDRLRAVQCPSDTIDQINGWTTDGVGQGYGSSYPMDVLKEWIRQVK